MYIFNLQTRNHKERKFQLILSFEGPCIVYFQLVIQFPLYVFWIVYKNGWNML